MRVLAADTSTPVMAVAVTDEQDIVAEVTVRADRRHAEQILAAVTWTLDQSGLKLGDLDLLAIAHGPGSFTGLRVGVSTWKGLASGAELPLTGVSTLAALARAVPADGVVVPMLDARMDAVYGAAFRWSGGQREALVDDSVGPVESILERLTGPAVFLGDGAQLYREDIVGRCPGASFAPAAHNVPRAALVAAEALDSVRAGGSTDAATVAPVYLRASQAERQRPAPAESGTVA